MRVAATRAQIAFFNAVFVTEPMSDGNDDLRSAVDLLRAEHLPFVVHVRADLPAEVEAARSLGLQGGDLLPAFAMEPPEPAAIPEPPDELEVSRVTEARFGDYLDTMALGFESSRAMFSQLFPPAMLSLAGLHCYLGSVEGRPVATSMGVRTGDVLGIYSVATVPEARASGYGTAMTWACVSDADPGVRVIALQASEMGQPIYEQMGFRRVRDFVELTGS